MINLITAIIYQPFFNLLVFYYHLLELIPGYVADMGVAVILLTLSIRLLLFPLTLASTRTKKERRAIEEAIQEAKKTFHNRPERLKQEIRSTFKSNRRIVISEGINFLIQMMIFFILYRIFSTGLLGADLHLLYNFMPSVELPFNLMFLGQYDLTHTNTKLNIIQSLSIATLEILSLIDSPFPVTRKDMVRYVIILPTASFVIFMFLPAGKKLFVITTLWFSIIYTLIRMINRKIQELLTKWENLGTKPSNSTDSQKPLTS